MHASYQLIIQVLQLAYTTQACISNLKTYAMQASTWICTTQMHSIKVHELALPTCVLLLSKNFDPSQFLNVAPSCPLSMSKFNFPWYLCTNLSSLIINFHKRCASLDTKGCSRDRWLTLESCIFYGHHLYSSLDTMCRILWPWYQL
jgi:hypothetical protein